MPLSVALLNSGCNRSMDRESELTKEILLSQGYWRLRSINDNQIDYKYLAGKRLDPLKELIVKFDADRVIYFYEYYNLPYDCEEYVYVAIYKRGDVAKGCYVIYPVADKLAYDLAQKLFHCRSIFFRNSIKRFFVFAAIDFGNLIPIFCLWVVFSYLYLFVLLYFPTHCFCYNQERPIGLDAYHHGFHCFSPFSSFNCF